MWNSLLHCLWTDFDKQNIVGKRKSKFWVCAPVIVCVCMCDRERECVWVFVCVFVSLCMHIHMHICAWDCMCVCVLSRAWESVDWVSDSLAFPTPDSRLFHPKKPTDSRLPAPSPRQIFEPEKISEIGSQIWESGVGHFLPTPDSRLLIPKNPPTPDSRLQLASPGIQHRWLKGPYFVVVVVLQSEFSKS